jgi:hypothetical protein
MYLKIPMNKNDLTFGYIKVKDDEGNNNVEEDKEERKVDKSKREICHSIRLGDVADNKQKSEEELNCEKRSKEFLDNIVIPLLVDKGIKQNNEEEQENTDFSTTLDNEEKNPNNEKENEPFDVEKCFTPKKIKEKNNGNENETKDEYPSKKLCPINTKSRHGIGNNINPNSIPDLKKTLAKEYLLQKDFKEKVGKYDESLSLEPKYEKGIQTIVRRLNIGEIKGGFLLDNNIGHVFIRYYDKSKGIDIIIESVENNGINEIRFSNFKKENLMKFKYFKILMEEEILNGKDYEDIRNKLIKKYKDKNGIINRGKYSLFSNNCYDTAEEILDLFGKSQESVKKLRREYFLPLMKQYEECLGDDWP